MNFKSICRSARCAAISLLVGFAPSLHGVFAATVQTASQPWVTNRIAQATNSLAQATLAKDYLVAPFQRGVNYAKGDLVEINGRFYIFVGPWSGASTADPVATGFVVELSDFRALAESLLAQSFLPLGEEGTNTESRKTIETAYDRYGVATYTFLPDGFEIRDLDGSTFKLQNTLIRYMDASTGTTKTLDLEEMIQFANVLPMYPQYMDAAHATNPTSPYYVGNYLSANYRTASDTTAEIAAATNEVARTAFAQTVSATNATLSAAKSYADQVGSATLSDALGNSQAYTDIAIENLPAWAKQSTKPAYTLNEVAPNTDNWLGVQGNAGRYIKVLAQTVAGIITGGVKISASTLNDNNQTAYMYNGIAVKRNGSTQDFLYDSSSANGIVRRSELSTTVTSMIREQSLGGIWDDELQVWWTPVMRNGSLTYHATTNINLNAEN